MKHSFFFLTILFLFSGCKKNPDDVSDPVIITYTSIPPSTPVNTSILAYTVGINDFTYPLYVKTDGAYYEYSGLWAGYNIKRVTSDKYSTVLSAQSAYTVNDNGYDTYKVITTLSTNKNYTNIQLLKPVGVGTLLYDNYSGTFTLPNKGQIFLPPYSFGNRPGSSLFSISANYLNPAISDYAITLPCYPMADENKTRWYLNSYGIYLIHSQFDFSPTADVIINMAIPPNLLATAPDSIPTWIINGNHVWQKSGYAKKVNNFYEKRIDHKGFWNFALPVNGVYITLHLRTRLGIAVPNTRFKIKNSNDEIADARTDAEGNALVFVPTDKALTMDIINDHYNSVPKFIEINRDLGSFDKATEKTFNMSDRIDLVTIEGSVFNCDGSPFDKGQVILSNNNAKDSYTIPVVNGQFKTSTWINYSYNFADLAIQDNAGNTIINHKVLLGSADNNYTPAIKQYNLNFYTCLDATSLYFKYRIDTTHYTITDDAKSSTPFLTGSDSQIDINFAGKGINLKGFFNITGNIIIGNFYDDVLKVNGVTCKYDKVKQGTEIFITRKDSNIGGIIEGWVSINYLDGNNIPHNLTGNFRVKKTA